jgi:predicted neuraminidase
MYCRSSRSIGRVAIADSNDGGITWSAARLIAVPNPNSGIDVVRLKDGRFIMVYNDTPRGRTPLNLAVSRDGENFTRFHDLETDAGEYSYPSMIDGSDGSLHITYTWRRERIKYVNFPLAAIPAH